MVSETFSSRQGEGKLTGTDSFFIRTSGCNLRCWFCDTPYASWKPTGTKQSVTSLVQAALLGGNRHVVLTGGEPLVAPAVKQLAEQLMQAGLHLTIETAGSVDQPIACDLLSLSPKLADSTPDPVEHPRWSRLHEERRLPVKSMRRLIDAAKETQLKFVVGSADQLDEIKTVVSQLSCDRRQVYLMPQGVSVKEMDAAHEWLKPLADAAGYHYCDRMQIRWFGNRRGT